MKSGLIALNPRIIALIDKYGSPCKYLIKPSGTDYTKKDKLVLIKSENIYK